MASSSTSPKPAIGVLSIGDMGMAIAKLLLAHDYQVLTVSLGRSQHTVDRVKSANIIDLESDEALVAQADIIFSIVPPRDAIATARRVTDACSKAGDDRRERKGILSPITYIDMNAVSPRTASNIAQLLQPPPPTPSLTRRLTRRLSQTSIPEVSESPVAIDFLDGGVIGPPPFQQSDHWKRPSIVLSGPVKLPDDLISTLNMKVVSDRIGQASALKACFASLTKGLTALSILSFTTAHTCGVLPELQSHLKEYSPATLALAEKGLTGMPPKAYRWVDEMRQIGETFDDHGGFGSSHGGKAIYNGIADIYKLVADDTVLGLEKTHKRKRGTTAEDVAEAMREGIATKAKKEEAGEEKLELTWRGSWS